MKQEAPNALLQGETREKDWKELCKRKKKRQQKEGQKSCCEGLEFGRSEVGVTTRLVLLVPVLFTSIERWEHDGHYSGRVVAYQTNYVLIIPEVQRSLGHLNIRKRMEVNGQDGCVYCVSQKGAMADNFHRFENWWYSRKAAINRGEGEMIAWWQCSALPSIGWLRVPLAARQRSSEAKELKGN